MEQEHHANDMTPTPGERRGLALSALLLAIVSLLCALIIGWRTFSIILALGSIFIGIWVLSRSPKGSRARRMAGFALVFALAGGAVATWHLMKNAQEEQDSSVPAELQDTTAQAPSDETLDKLRMSMDSAQGDVDSSGH